MSSCRQDRRRLDDLALEMPAVEGAISIFEEHWLDLIRGGAKAPAFPELLQARSMRRDEMRGNGRVIRCYQEAARLASWLSKALPNAMTVAHTVKDNQASRADVILAPPARPSWMLTALDDGATGADVALSFLERQPRRLAESIVQRSHLEPGNFRYATVENFEGLAIEGENGCRVLHMSAIAHELGHAIWESSNGWSNLLQQAESEAIAIALEERLVLEFCSRLGNPAGWRQTWAGYQRDVDRYSLILYLVEATDLECLEPLSLSNLGLPASVFKPALSELFLRESFYVCPGSQCCYMVASALRLAFMKSKRWHEWTTFVPSLFEGDLLEEAWDRILGETL